MTFRKFDFVRAGGRSRVSPQRVSLRLEVLHHVLQVMLLYVLGESAQSKTVVRTPDDTWELSGVVSDLCPRTTCGHDLDARPMLTECGSSAAPR